LKRQEEKKMKKVFIVLSVVVGGFIVAYGALVGAHILMPRDESRVVAGASLAPILLAVVAIRMDGHEYWGEYFLFLAISVVIMMELICGFVFPSW